MFTNIYLAVPGFLEFLFDFLVSPADFLEALEIRDLEMCEISDLFLELFLSLSCGFETDLARMELLRMEL